MICSHPKLIEGLDHSYCPACGQFFRQPPASIVCPPPKLETSGLPLLTEKKVLTESTTADAPPAIMLSASNAKSMLTENDRIAYGSNGDGVNQAVYEYTSHGRRYFRYVCSVGHQIAISRHIPGGCTDNPLAQSRAIEVGRWIYQNYSPPEIERGIKAWNRGSGRRSHSSRPAPAGEQTPDK